MVNHHFAEARFADVAVFAETDASLADILAAQGVISYSRDITQVVARRPSHSEVALLGIPASQPVLDTLSRGIDDQDQPVFVTRAVSRADRMRVSF